MDVVNAAADVGALDFYLLAPSQPVSDATATFNALSYLTNGTVSVEAGAYDVVFTAAGEETVLFGPERITVDARGLNSLYLAEAPGGGTPLRLVRGGDLVR